MKETNTNPNIYDTSIRLVFLALIIGWCLMILLPFTSIILWSFILGIAFTPLHNKLAEIIGGRPKLASLVIVLACLAIFIFPAWLFLDSLIDNVKELKTSFQAGSLSIPPPPSESVKTWPVIGEKLYEIWYSASTDLGQTIIKYKSEVVGVGSKIAKGIISVGGGILQLLVALIIAGVLLAIQDTGESVRKVVRKLADKRGDEFADVIKITVGNVVKGVLGVAFIQATLVGIGFFLADIPYAGIWTLLVFLLAVLQIPPPLVVIPVAVYLFSEKSTATAILWTVYLMLGGLSDNILKPILLGKGAPVPMLVIFLGVIGGFMLSGFIGLFTGAVVMSIGYKIFTAWINTGPTAENSVE
ncbi:MAG TPA: AI-2E family transporter [Thermodesulfobacteriota bacterium]|nr:AI-2E family transporter [Thermodesulfobacteriota bacterium]